MVSKLIETLTLEVPLYKELLGLIQEEKRLLSKRSGEELYELSSNIEALVHKITSLEALRAETVSALALKLDIPAKDINLTKLIAHIKGTDKARLSELQSTILAIMGSIDELNRQNSVVVGTGIENVKNAFSFIKELSTLQTYQPTGKTEGSGY